MLTGLYYYGARYYDPNKSIFLGVDPLAEKYSFQSSYAYAANNPIKYIDWMGMGADGFTINGDNDIKRVDNTGGKNYDVLYTKKDYDVAKSSGQKNAYGNPEPKDQVRVSNGTISEMINNKRTIKHPIVDSGGETTGEIVTSVSYKLSNDKDAQGLMAFFDMKQNVEWANCLLGDKKGMRKNLLISSNEESTITGGIYHRYKHKGFEVLRHDHIHPGGSPIPSKWDGDWWSGELILETSPNAKFRILTNGQYYGYKIPKR